MSLEKMPGISRQGLDEEFTRREIEKSNLLLQAKWQRETGVPDEAARLFAAAATLEEELANLCQQRGLTAKELTHRFSAAGCWMQAGDFHHAASDLEKLLSRDDIPAPLREKAVRQLNAIRERRARWYAELVEQTGA